MSSRSLVQNLSPLTDKNTPVYKWGIYNIGKSMIGNFEITDDLSNIFNNLLKYFTGNEGEYDLSKNIYLFGDIGVGKTMTMAIFSKFLAEFFPFSKNGFGCHSVESILEYYKVNGNLTKFGRYYEGDLFSPKRICINEFGLLIKEKNYGTELINIFNSFFKIRYELFQEYNIATHITSNYNPKDLTVFDEPIIDRLCEMYNFIEVGGTSFRRK